MILDKRLTMHQLVKSLLRKGNVAFTICIIEDKIEAGQGN